MLTSGSPVLFSLWALVIWLGVQTKQECWSTMLLGLVMNTSILPSSPLPPRPTRTPCQTIASQEELVSWWKKKKKQSLLDWPTMGDLDPNSTDDVYRRPLWSSSPNKERKDNDGPYRSLTLLECSIAIGPNAPWRQFVFTRDCVEFFW